MANQIPNKKPPFRKLRGYAFDPSLSLKIDTVAINDLVYKIPWEELDPGPSGEYVEVIDYDPTVNKFYRAVDLDDDYILAQDGLDPSESNPQFHQQIPRLDRRGISRRRTNREYQALAEGLWR